MAWPPRVHGDLLHNRVLRHRISERRVVNCRVLHTSVNRSPISQWPAAIRMRIKHREQVFEGFDNLPNALVDLLSGRNFGKVVVRLTE